MAHNNNIGELSAFNVSIKGSGDLDTTSDEGSILGLRYIKDDEVTPTDVDSVTLKNWFSQFVGTLGKFNKESDDDKNIKWGDYRGATILGFKVRVVNEVPNKYANNNNAGIIIAPLNGSLGSYTVTAGDQSTTVIAGDEVELGRGGGRFDSGQSIPVYITDNTTNVRLAMTWFSGYGNDSSSIIGSSTVAGVGRGYTFDWDNDNLKSEEYSNPLYFFLGEESTRLYGTYN